MEFRHGLLDRQILILAVPTPVSDCTDRFVASHAKFRTWPSPGPEFVHWIATQPTVGSIHERPLWSEQITKSKDRRQPTGASQFSPNQTLKFDRRVWSETLTRIAAKADARGWRVVGSPIPIR
jgi:hypothetical protein